MHCEVTRIAKQEPKQRTAAVRRLYVIRLDAHGAIDRIVQWNESLRKWRQMGAQIPDVDERPDAPHSPEVAAYERDTPVEQANTRRARAIVEALDRRDTAAIEDPAVGLVWHPIESAEPRVFASANEFRTHLGAELAECSASAYRVLAVSAAEAWVVLRFGRTCRLPGGDREVYGARAWLMRFSGDKLAELWSFSTRYHEWLQREKLKTFELHQIIAAAGL